MGLVAVLSLGLAVPAHAADLVVSAAASLTNAFKTIAQQYEVLHPDTKVVLNFGASDVLMQQIARGAPADVFASADQEAMNKAVAEKAIKADADVSFVGPFNGTWARGKGRRKPGTKPSDLAGWDSPIVPIQEKRKKKKKKE